MLKNTEQFTEAAQKSVDTVSGFLQTSLEGMEKLTKINLDASKKFWDEASKALKDMTRASNPQDLFDRANQLATENVESQICNCRDVYELITATQTKIGKIIEDQLQSTQQNVANAVEGLAGLNLGKNSFATDSLKSWMNSANQAMNTMSKMAAQASEFANNNIKTVTQATVSAVKKDTTKHSK